MEEEVVEYDEKILRKLQLTQLEILKDIDKFCRENEIEYCIAYGTTLGAVRHGGFIPWDDDIDICMKRAEYEKFLELAKQGMKEKYDILNIYETKGYISTFSKVSKKGTKFVEASSSNENYQQGIFVDVFPLDYTSDNKEERQKDFKKSWFLARIMMLCEISNPILPSTLSAVKKMISKLGCKIIHGCLKIIGCNKIKVYQRYLKCAVKYNEQENAKYLADYQLLKPEKTVLLEKDIFPPKLMKFEDAEFPVPGQVDVYLKKIYGNYMELPPVEARHNHMAKLLVFGDEDR